MKVSHSSAKITILKKRDHKYSVKIGKKRRRRWRPAQLDFMFDLLGKEN